MSARDADSKFNLKAFFAFEGSTQILLSIVLFVAIAIIPICASNLFGADVYDTRIIGIALSGFFLGFPGAAIVAVATGLVSILLAMPTLSADLVAMVLTAVLTGICHHVFPRNDGLLAGIVVGAIELVHMLLILALLHPIEVAKEFVYTNSFMHIVVSGCAVMLFIFIVDDLNTKRNLWQKESALKSELAISANIQRSLLESKFDIDERLDLDAQLTPAKDVGGDLYGFSLVEDRYFRFILGDVSGKGVPASITMSRSKTAFQVHAHEQTAPANMLEAMNVVLCEGNRTRMFVTAIAGVLDLETGLLTYANAGHTAPVIVNGQGAASLMEKTPGMPLGVFDKAHYGEMQRTLQPGEHMLLYTDGITEAENTAKDLFGTQNMLDALSAAPAHASANKLNSTLLNAVAQHAKGAAQSDDIALLTIGWNGPLHRDNENDSVGTSLHYRMTNSLEELAETERTMAIQLTEMGIAEEIRGDIALIFEELVTNIVKYGYADQQVGSISIAISFEDEAPCIVIEDDSRPFNPFKHADPDVTLPPRERPIGGLGIFMVRKRVSSYTYTPAYDVNDSLAQKAAEEAAQQGHAPRNKLVIHVRVAARSPQSAQ